MRILQIVHGFPPWANGGTEVYVRNLARALASDDEDRVFVLTRIADSNRPEYSVDSVHDGRVEVIRVNNTFQACASFEESYTNPELADEALREIRRIQPDVVHVQHLTCLSTLLLEAIARERIPVVMTLNDYWLLCHRGQLFDLDERRCAGPFEAQCSACLPAGALGTSSAFRAGRLARSSRIPGLAGAAHYAIKGIEAVTPRTRTLGPMLSRLRHMQSVTRHVTLFLAPSATMEEWMLRFGVEREKLLRWEQGVETEAFTPSERTASARLRLGYAGGLMPSKAPHVLLEALMRVPRGVFSIDLMGHAASFHGDDSYARRIAPLIEAAPVRRFGPVPPERMPQALAAIDLLVVPSVWPENAPFIIKEAFAASVPVIAADLGGMAELVRHDIDGLLFEPGNAASLARVLSQVAEEPELVDRLRANIRVPRSIQDEARGLRDLYRKLPVPQRSSPASPRPRPVTAGGVTAIVLNYRTREQTWLAIRSLQTSHVQPSRIIAVDNGSGDGSAVWLRDALANVEVVETGTNLGFSGGCNAGLSRALEGPEAFALLVNSDVVLRPDALGILLRVAAAHPRAGVVGPVLLSREEPDRIASAGLVFSQDSGRIRHRDAGRRLSHLPTRGPHEVDAMSGCVMLIRTDVLRRVGLLAEEFFFSFEDIEFCLRVRAADYTVLCVPDAIAYHEGGRSIGRRSARRVYYATRNHLYLVHRSSGTLAARAARAGFVVGLNAAYALTSRDVPLVGGMAAVVRGTWDHLRGRYGAG